MIISHYFSRIVELRNAHAGKEKASERAREIKIVSDVLFLKNFSFSLPFVRAKEKMGEIRFHRVMKTDTIQS